MTPRTLRFSAAAAGLVCALALWWALQPDTRTASAPAAAAPASAAADPAAPVADAAPTAAVTTADPRARQLLTALVRSLMRRDVRPRETVLTFKDDAALARFLERAARAGVTVLGRLDATHSLRVHVDDLRALQAELAQNAGDYEDASANYVFAPPQIPAKEARAAQNQIPFHNDALPFLGITNDHSQWGRGVTIAVLDTGVSADPTFGNGRVTTLNVGLGLTPGNGSDDGHGTAVASLAAGGNPDAAGVAPAANLLSIRVTDANGTSDIFTLAQAIVTAVDAGAKVINISLGGYSTNGALNAAINYAVNAGSVIVAAAGNDQAAQLSWPAADPRVISVGAVDKAEQQVTFSNSGPQLKLSAPGLGVQTAWLGGERAYVDGTSASAPLVSGAIAALLSQSPSLTPAGAAQLLIQTASDAGAPGPDAAYGAGILNVGWAMNASNPGYVDTAVASHYYDAANHEMDFVVQNRSGRALGNLSLAVAAGTTTTDYLIGSLAPGESQTVRVPVDAAQLAANGSIPYTTTLTNPLGVTDQVPANNRRTSVLTAPAKTK